METRSYVFVALQINEQDSQYEQFNHKTAKEKVDFIVQRIRDICETLKIISPNVHLIFGWNEYGIGGSETRYISVIDKAYLKDKFSQLTKDFPITLIAGTVALVKPIPKMDENRLNRIIGYYQNRSFLTQEKTDLYELIDANKEKYLKYGATIIRNVCYVFESGECIYRYDKSEPYKEFDSNETEKIFQPGNKKGNIPLLICHGKLRVFIELCFEHQLALGKTTNFKLDLQLLISNTTSINTNNIIAPFFIQLDSRRVSFPIVSGNNHFIQFLRINLFSENLDDLNRPLPLTNLSNSLFLACYQDNTAQIQKIMHASTSGSVSKLSDFSETELYGTSSLHLMIEKRQDEDLINLLLKRKVDVNSINRANQTPLYLAVKTRQDDIVYLLIRNGANVDDSQLKQSNPLSPLALAVVNDDIENVKLLIHAGANVNAKIDDKPLILYAMESQYWEVATELIKADASLMLNSDDKQVLLSLARVSKNNSLQSLLLSKLNAGSVKSRPNI